MNAAGAVPRVERRRRTPKHIHLSEPALRPGSSESNIYMGSYGKKASASPHSSVKIFGSMVPSPRTSTGHLQLHHLLRGIDVETDTYGLDELRDGFFDAFFYRPLLWDRRSMSRRASQTPPTTLQQPHPFSFLRSFMHQRHEVVNLAKELCSTRSGIKLLKTFLGFFTSYILCLVPSTRDWLGTYSYVIAISAIINHSGRSIGSQIDGAFMTSLGTVAGLLWGSLALLVATCTPAAEKGYGGIIALFLIISTSLLAWLRCVYIRFYQAVICAGMALCYICLADTLTETGWSGPGWTKFSRYAVPWALGQAVSLLISFLIFPAGGGRPVCAEFHNSLELVRAALVLPRPESASISRGLSLSFVRTSQVTRDYTIEIAISPLDPGDVRLLRNMIQGIIRVALSIRSETLLFDTGGRPEGHSPQNCDAIIDFRPLPPEPSLSDRTPAQVVSSVLAVPTKKLIQTLGDAIKRADAAFMDISGYRGYLGPPESVSSDIEHMLNELAKDTEELAEAEQSLASYQDLPHKLSDQPELVELFLFIHPIQQMTEKVTHLLNQLISMQNKRAGWRVHLPSYPLSKAMSRSNAQVRHDRGGLTAGFYFHYKLHLEKTMADLASTAFVPTHRDFRHTPTQLPENPLEQATSNGRYEDKKMDAGREEGSPGKQKLRYRFWVVLHWFQGYESRFALKATLLTTLISIPAWMADSRGWWNRNECWLAVLAIWVNMHPRVGGNVQDMIIRASCTVLGALWGAFAYAAGGGDPWAIAAFATIFMVPMLYRFSQSSHPRSGINGSLSFTIVSLIIYNHAGLPSVLLLAWTRGTAMAIGVVAAIIINWLLWPFLARHQMRKSISGMLLHLTVLYRGVVSNYVYYNMGHQPSRGDIARSEMLEGRLREGFVRIRQLLELTRHEVRLRAPFNPLPYSALIEACELFFERLVEVRQSSIYFQPYMLSKGDDSSDSILAARRDAVAAILMNLYTLAGALRSGRPVPRYLPSAASARRRLLDKMEQIETKSSANSDVPFANSRQRWADVYYFAFSSALTDIVEQLQHLQYYTKEIVGEIDFGISL